MNNQFTRLMMQIGAGGLENLKNSRVAVFGIGGVGGHCAEALARAGVGGIDLYDSDTVCITNINRQTVALMSTVGRYKVDVMKERILDINPQAAVEAHRLFYSPETAGSAELSQYSYIVDAIDTVTAKLELICRARQCGIPIISSMGAANKLDASALTVADIYATSVCPLARVMRRELKKRGIPALKVVYSKEEATTPKDQPIQCCGHPNCCKTDGAVSPRRQIPSSNSFVPPVAGLIIAGEVIKDLI